MHLDKSAPKMDKALKAIIAIAENEIKTLQSLLSAAKQAETALKLAHKANSRADILKVYPKFELATELLFKLSQTQHKIDAMQHAAIKGAEAAWKETQTEIKFIR